MVQSSHLKLAVNCRINPRGFICKNELLGGLSRRRNFSRGGYFKLKHFSQKFDMKKPKQFSQSTKLKNIKKS